MLDVDKEALINGSATIQYKISFDDNELDEYNIINTTYEDYRYVDSDSLVIGQFVARTFKGEIDSVNKNLNVEDKDIHVSMGINSGTEVAEVTIDGNSYQETTNGYQLFDESKLPSKTQNGVTLTNNGDGSFTIMGEGNPTANFNYNYNYTHEETVKLLKDGNITISDNGNTEHITSPYFLAQLRNSSGVIFEINNRRLNVHSSTITQEMLDDESTILIIGFYASANKIITPSTVKPMLFQEGDGKFEKFTGGEPIPNPENPQEIKTVIGIEVEGKDGKWMVLKNANNIRYTNYFINMNKYNNDGNIIGYYELGSIHNNKDILNIDKYGNIVLKKNIKKIILDGTEPWEIVNKAFQINIIFPNNLKNVEYAQSSHYKLGIYPVGITSQIKNNEFGWNRNKLLTIRDDRFSTVNEFKSFLQLEYDKKTPVEIYYVIEKEELIKLEQNEQINLFPNEENNFSLETNIETSFSIITTTRTTEWYSLGNFLITKPSDDDVKDKISFESMDYTKKFNQPFKPELVQFPCTASVLAQKVCEQCDIELATLVFKNCDFIVENNQYTEGESCRKVMQDIGKLAYSWIRIGWDNKCYIDFELDNNEVDKYNIIPSNKYYDLSLQKDIFGPVNRVIIGMKDVEGENLVVEDTESIESNGVTEIKIYDNNLTYTPELREQVIEEAKSLFGLEYIPLEINTIGHPWLLGKEKVEVIGGDGTKYITYPWDRTIEYKGHIKTKLTSKSETRTETEYKYYGGLEDSLRRTRIIVNKQEGTITNLTQRTDNIQNNLTNDYYTITQTNEMIQNAENGVTNTFSEAGGNNIFRNTGLWFLDEEDIFEFWIGKAKRGTNDNATLNSSILLQTGTFKQEQDVPNGKYSVSFYYTKLNQAANASVTINDKTYPLDSTETKQFYTGEQNEDGEYIVLPLEVTTKHLSIAFTTNINNSIEIYDLMVNKGAVKLAYSQNENEVTTDTVNISKGITITSTNYDVIFKANANGIKIVHKNNENDIITYFTDKGMTTKQAKIEDEADICKVLFRDMGEQTWITRL